MADGIFWRGHSNGPQSDGVEDPNSPHKSDSVHTRLRANSSIMQLNKILGTHLSTMEAAAPQSQGFTPLRGHLGSE